MLVLLIIVGVFVAFAARYYFSPGKSQGVKSGKNFLVTKNQNTCKAALKTKRNNNFVAIDFETANDRYYSACSLGIVVFKDGKPVERKSFLIKPPTKFNPENIQIHGITPEMVADAPSFDKIWNQVIPYITQGKVVMYSDFDAKVLKSLIRHFNLEGEYDIDCVDVCDGARDTIIGLTNYKLPTVCEYLEIGGLTHHEATSDAEACGKIYAWLIENCGEKVIAGHGSPASYAQQDYIRHLGGKVPPVLSHQEASKMIDGLIAENERRRVEEQERCAMAREEARRVKQEEKEQEQLFKKRKKEEDALKLLADEMSSPDYKPSKSRSKRTRELQDFQVLVNKIIEDNVIETSELLDVKDWLIAHKVLDDDFVEMIQIIDQAESAGKFNEDETQLLYASLLDCLISVCPSKT